MSQNAPHRLSGLGLVWIVGLALVGGGVSLAGVATGAGSRTVTIDDIAFSPSNLTVAQRTRVRFAFRDDGTTHNVTSTAGKRFKTIGDRESGSPSRIFTRAGTYRYECTLHPGMTGRITVR